MDETQHHLRGKLQVDTEFGTFLGDTRIRLLEAIATHGSISQAAKSVPLSYKGAWDAVDIMNNLADFPLVVRLTGGRSGGGTTLTDYGRKVVALYRALEDEYQAALDRLAATMKDEGAGDYKEFRKLLKRMSMKASARNQFAGEITALRKGDVDFEVHIRLDAENELVSVITRESAENLGLQIGMDINALVKSSSILLLTDASLKTTARNRIWGEITRISDGAVNAEITLSMPSGKTVCAVLTHSSVEQLGLAVGHSACAVFKASSVILCHYA